MKLHNLMEKCVADVMDEILVDCGHICTCEKCKLDIMAIALNNLAPKYVVTKEGLLYAKLDRLSQQLDVDLAKEIIKAAEIVKNNPHHDGE